MRETEREREPHRVNQVEKRGRGEREYEAKEEEVERGKKGTDGEIER